MKDNYFIASVLSFILFIPFSANALTIGGGLSATERSQAINFGKQQGASARADSRNINQDAVSEQINDGDINVSEHGYQKTIDDVRVLPCQKVDSAKFQNTSIIGKLLMYCYTPNEENYYVYACLNSLLNIPCSNSDWYIVESGRNLPDVILSDPSDIIENISATIKSCNGKNCLVNVRYIRTLDANQYSLEQSGRDAVVNKKNSNDPLTNMMLSPHRDLIGEENYFGNGRCLNRSMSSVYSGDPIPTCDGSSTVGNLAGSNCTTVQTCTDWLEPVQSIHTCTVTPFQNDKERITWEFPEGSYGSCRKLKEYRKVCHDFYDWVSRSSSPVYETRYRDCYQSNASVCGTHECGCHYVTTSNTTTDPDTGESTTTYSTQRVCSQCANSCLVTNGCSYQVVKGYNYYDRVVRSYGTCYYTGNNVNLSCGDDVDAWQADLLLVFMAASGRFPTAEELTQVNSITNSQNLQTLGQIFTAIKSSWGFNADLVRAYTNLTGSSSYSSAISNLNSSAGDEGINAILVPPILSTSQRENLVKGAACFTLDYSMSNVSLASSLYNYARNGNINGLIGELMPYAQNESN